MLAKVGEKMNGRPGAVWHVKAATCVVTSSSLFADIENPTTGSSHDADTHAFDGHTHRRDTAQDDRRHRHRDAAGIGPRDRRLGEWRPA
jgi:hypothetical protein